MASRVVSLCVYIAEGVTAWQYFSHQFPPQRKAWQAGLGMAAAYGIAWALFTPYRMWSNTVLFTLANLLSLCVFFTCSWKASVFHSVLLTCLMVASELIVEIPLGVLLGGFEKYQTSFLVFSVLSAFSKLLYFMLTKLCTVFIKDKDASRSHAGPVALLLGSFSAVSVFVLVVLIYTATLVELPLGLEVSMLAGAFLLLFSNLLVFAGYQYSQRMDRQYLSLQLMQQKELAAGAYYSALEEQYDQQRILIHDIRKHLDTILGLIKGGSYEEAVTGYVLELQSSPALQNRVRICGNPTLDVILSRYREICQAAGVDFSTDIRSKALERMAPSDITSLFGNLLENAVEAAAGGETPYIQLLADSRSGYSLRISLVNSCQIPPIPDKAGGLLTHKANKGKHGLGLKSIQAVTKKYRGQLQQYYDKEERLFHTLILFPKIMEP